MAAKYMSMEHLRYVLYDVMEAEQLFQYERFQDHDTDSLNIFLDSIKDFSDQEVAIIHPVTLIVNGRDDGYFLECLIKAWSHRFRISRTAIRVQLKEVDVIIRILSLKLDDTLLYKFVGVKPSVEV